MATRTRSLATLGFAGTQTHVKNHSLSSQLAPVTVRLLEQNESMTDVVVPNFRQRIANGEVINNPCTKTKTLRTFSGGGSYYGYYKADPSKYNIVSGPGSQTGFWLQYWSCPRLTVSLTPVGDDIQQARVKAYASVDKAPYAIAEDLAEIRQTVKFLRHPFASLDGLSKRFKKARNALDKLPKRGFNPLRRTQNLSSLWLEYQFAFKPLSRSIVTIIDSLNRPKPKRDRIQTAHGQVETMKSNSDNFGAANHFSRTCEVTRTVRATIQYRVQPPLREWQYKYGLRFKDIPELMWDLFPMSFMYDRIFDVGSAIRGLTNFIDPSISLLGGVVSTSTFTKQTRKVTGQTHPQWTVVISGDVETLETTSYSRVLFNPNDPFFLVPPVLPGGLVKDLSSMADLAALVIQRLR
jgi:hypothetical protein